MNKLAYVVIRGAEPGKRIGIVKRGESGYYLTDLDSTATSIEFATEMVAKLNADLGVSSVEATAMEIGSMFGWDVPGAKVPTLH